MPRLCLNCKKGQGSCECKPEFQRWAGPVTAYAVNYETGQYKEGITVPCLLCNKVFDCECLKEE